MKIKIKIKKILYLISLLMVISGCAACFLLGYAYTVFFRAAEVPHAAEEMLFPEKKDFKVAVFGDFAMQTGVATPIMREISSGDADFVICTGDIFRHPSISTNFYLRKLFKNNITKPYFVTPGNHDRSDDNLVYYRLFSETQQYYFTCGDTLFIVCDTSDCSFDNRRAQYVEYVLKTHRANYKRCVLIAHTPPVEAPILKYPANKNLAGYLNKLTGRYKIDAVISGHFHIAEVLDFNGIPVYISPSSGQRIRDKKNPFYGYLMLHFKEDGSIQDTYIFKPELKRSRNYFYGFLCEKVLDSPHWFICSVCICISGIIIMIFTKLSYSRDHAGSKEPDKD